MSFTDSAIVVRFGLQLAPPPPLPLVVLFPLPLGVLSPPPPHAAASRASDSRAVPIILIRLILRAPSDVCGWEYERERAAAQPEDPRIEASSVSASRRNLRRPRVRSSTAASRLSTSMGRSSTSDNVFAASRTASPRSKPGRYTSR